MIDKKIGAKSFEGIVPFKKKVWLASPTMHEEELYWLKRAIDTNWVTTTGENINELESYCADMIGRKFAVGLSCGTAALHMAIRLCGQKLYGMPRAAHGTLEGKKVFCSDMTFDATVNPVAYEGGEAVFIDTDPDTWNMDPKALEKAFEIYPDVRLVVVAHLYGLVGKIDKIVEICHRHNALLVEDAAESFGATYNGIQTGMFGDVSIISFNGNKIVTGSSGGLLLTDSEDDACLVRKWSTQSREAAPWYQHEELGYNYRLSNIIAGVARGNVKHLYEHIAQKKAIFERYKEGLKDLPVQMYPVPDSCKPNYWLSCITINRDGMCETEYGEKSAVFTIKSGKSCPTEILETLEQFNAQGRPIWKPMHLQPIYKANTLITASGPYDGSKTYKMQDISKDIFERGLCLPSDNKMTKEQQDLIIEIIHRCFK